MLKNLGGEKTLDSPLARGVYPYLPMATNAPWSILGGNEKISFGGNEKV